LQSLQSEVTALKMTVHSKNNALSSLQSEYDDVRQQHEDQKELIAKLEDTLADFVNPKHSASDSDSSPNHTADTATNHDPLYRILTNRHDENEGEKKVKEGPSPSIAIPIDDAPTTDEYGSMPLAPSKEHHRRRHRRHSEAKEEDSAFLIICQQRDRFRKKAEKLEAMKIKMGTEMDRICAENATLKKENVELYSKMKFLESYNSAKRSFTPHSSSVSNRRARAAEAVEEKYESLYEESMNPFAVFRRRQMEHRINSLPWTEWVAFMVGSTVMSKRVFRAFGVFYALGLHLLVFFTLFHEYRTHHIFDHHPNELDQPLPVLLDLGGVHNAEQLAVPGLDGIGDSGE